MQKQQKQEHRLLEHFMPEANIWKRGITMLGLNE